MDRVHALWIPFWYECDQTLVVGERREHWFFKDPPPAFRAMADLVFSNGLDLASEASIAATGTVASITHATLGAVASIDTTGLVYTMTLEDGTEVRIEAEETPGVAEERRFEGVTDWRLYVVLNDVTFASPSPASSPR